MVKGLIGRKVGMTQVFDEDGNHIPVTVLEVGPCIVVGLRTALGTSCPHAATAEPRRRETTCSTTRFAFV